MSVPTPPPLRLAPPLSGLSRLTEWWQRSALWGSHAPAPIAGTMVATHTRSMPPSMALFAQVACRARCELAAEIKGVPCGAAMHVVLGRSW